MANLIKELWRRFHAPTPEFWKKIRRFMLQSSAALLALAGGINASAEVLPEWTVTVANYSASIGTGVGLLTAFVASFTTDSPKSDTPS